jgi:hypothetical protein
VASLGGYLTEAMGKVPRKGRVLEDKEVVFKILDASDKAVLKVKAVKRKTPLTAAPAEAAPKPPRKRKPKSAVPEGAPAEASAEEAPKQTPPERPTE